MHYRYPGSSIIHNRLPNEVLPRNAIECNSNGERATPFDLVTKPSNPKDLVGGNKVSMSCVPMNVIMEASLGLAEGMCKYGRHNYREVGVRASIYYDALMRHIVDWWEGEDIDPDSGLSHVTKAISDLIVLRDSMLRNNWTDDRPPKSPRGWMQPLNTAFKEIKVKYQHMTPVHYFEVKGLK